MSRASRCAVALLSTPFAFAIAFLVASALLAPAPAVATEGDCLGDISCSANDFSQIQVVTTIVGGDDCGDGELDLQLDWTVTRQGSGASRFDIGFWVPVDSLDARSDGPTCERGAVLADTSVFFQDDADGCRDFPSGPVSGTFTQFATVQCVQGTVQDRVMCLSWDNLDADNCDGDLDLAAGTPSKCQCVLASIDGGSEPVPTMAEWGLGALGVLLLAAGALAMRRGGLV